ncbi:Ca-dependent carbohydrate-binding module xylan-binding [Neorhodopirellula lusitana]|uniref:Ca-dependent carbohydrate-binding module xylan-binding n=1 Tax=Neorhodopirellula lusitana TaxID=445327 RepID=A0ABY1QHJ2_9BACT|nr:peroxidase family protein [Neorhodopirellula lusitana]SMP71721.1 Ca-dependent carbohydrate-binding module xylan-binding [Neorhodopirellula lusitana]
MPSFVPRRRRRVPARSFRSISSARSGFAAPTVLEPRVMLAGDVAQAMDVSAEAGEIRAEDSTSLDAPSDADQATGHARSPLADIVFIDPNVPDVETLMAGIPRSCKAVLLAADQDGLAQVSRVLATHCDIRAVHIISHGSDGLIQLGNESVDTAMLSRNASTLSQWKAALSDDADILLYGCDVSASVAGEQFVAAIASLTGADVAASNNRTGSTDRGGDWVLETATGAIESSLVVRRDTQERYEAVLPITIQAAGQTGQENMELRVDGNTVASWSNIGGNFANREFQSFSYDGPVDSHVQKIQVVFTNDQYVAGELDRNLYIDRISIGNTTIQTEDAAVFSTGTWREGIGVQPGNVQSEALHVNGYFEFQNPVTNSSTIEIDAAGATGSESMRLWVDGEAVANWDNVGGDASAGNFERYRFTTNAVVTAEQVRIEFTNDLYVEGQTDRNLTVDKIAIDGVSYQTESGGTFSTGTWKSEDGVFPGFRQSETLHANGYFRYSRDVSGQDFRSIDGFGNNLDHPEWGAANAELIRVTESQYGDGVSSPAGEDRPSAREISNVLAETSPTEFGNARAMSAIVHVWGQFIDHDMDLTEPPASGGETIEIAIPTGDPYFDPAGTGTATMTLTRSEYIHGTGTDPTNPREHANAITAFIDGSMVYGSSVEVNDQLREFSGGRLRSTAGDLLPKNVDGSSDAGDIRVDENTNLTSMHTLFMREHNYQAGVLAGLHPDWSDEQLFQEARQTVIAEIQAITFNEFLPALLGDGAISSYTGYDSSVNPGIATEFSSAAYRMGHTLINNEVKFIGNGGDEVSPAITLAQAFFNPSIIDSEGIDSSLKFLSSIQAQEIDTRIISSLRNFLFGEPGSGGFDLASLNIARGRDHGLADYNTTREAYGLERVASFDQITSDVDLQQKLESLYGSVDDIDLWVGGLSEDHAAGSSVGELIGTIIADQFQRTRQGDSFWYENALPTNLVDQVNQTTLADIIRRNSSIDNIQDNVFFMQSGVQGRVYAGSTSSGQVGFPMVDIAINLYNAQGDYLGTSRTNANGEYQFNNIGEVGAYRVQMLLATQYDPGSTTFQDIWVSRGDQTIASVDFNIPNANQFLA